MSVIPENQLVLPASMDDRRMRIDQFLTAKLPEHSRSLINKFIKMGAITTNDGRCVKPSQLITGNECFVFRQPEKEPSGMQPEALPLEIIFSDDHIAVINKPAGMVVHPGAGVNDGTLCNALLHHFPGMVVGNVLRPGIVHRLDKDTSGLMVIAKTEHAHRTLSEAFKERRVQKIYRVMCHGEFVASSFVLRTGHARHPRIRLRFTTKISEDKCVGHNVRFAHTSFKVLSQRLGMSLLEAEIHTGRTHQIRAHLADINHPLLGDELYGGKRPLSARVPEDIRTALSELSGQALHAQQLIFNHPETNERLNFAAPVPLPFARIEQLLF